MDGPRLRTVSKGDVETCLTAYRSGLAPDAAAERAAVKYLLARLTAAAPGHSVEVRVAPYAAVQAVAGGRHRRGTPRASVEAEPATWIRLAVGAWTWAEALDSGTLIASGERSDLSPVLPLL